MWFPITSGWQGFAGMTDACESDFLGCIFMEIHIMLSMLFTDDGRANNGNAVGAANRHRTVVSKHGNWG